MRPIRLVIEGLRSFRAPVTIDFDDRDHVAIIGDTGAGKSSILEAITYALYGKTTFSAQANQELMNDTSTRLRVVLRFRVSGEEWEAARTLRRAGDNTVGSATATLQRFDANGQPVDIVQQVTPVNERVAALIGLNRDAFLRTVVLPQGRFARLLVGDSPAERSTILRQVWRTDEMEEVGRLAREARETIFETRVRLEAQAERYPENPAAHLAELQEKSTQAVAEAEAASELESRATESAAALDQAREEGLRALRAIDALSSPAISLEDLEPVAVKAKVIGEEEALLATNQDALLAERSQVPADDDGPTGTEVIAAIAQLDGLMLFLVGNAEANAEELRNARKVAQRKIEEAKRAAQSAREKARQVEVHGRDRDQIANLAEAAKSRHKAIAARWDACSVSSSALADATGALSELRARERNLAAQCEDALAECKRLERAVRLAEDHLTLIQRANLAASAAEGLHPGEDCPICSSKLEQDWVAPASGDLDEGGTALKKAKKGAERARSQAAGLEAQLQNMRERIGETGNSVEEAENKHELALAELARMVDLDVEGELPERAKLLEPSDAAMAAADRTLTAHDEEHRQLLDEGQRLETQASVTEESSANAEAALSTANRDAEHALKRLAEGVERVPEVFRPKVPLPEDPVDLISVEAADVEARRVAAAARRTVLDDRASERQRLQQESSMIQAALAELADRRHLEVESPFAEIARKLNVHRDLLVQVANQLAVDAELPAALLTHAIDAVTTQVTAQLDFGGLLVKRATDIGRAAKKAESAAREDLHILAERVGTVIGDMEGLVVKVREAATDADFLQRQVQGKLDRFQLIESEVRELLALVAEVAAKERALTDLENALKPGAFMKWLTQRRSRSLLLHASRTLERMTGGRYAFADPDDVEDQWRIFDSESGQARSPESLSGGEQFIASLALAIGMVEMMARSGGRLESLFLDEGFGALDRSNLDAALEALTTAVTGGRMLGIISHVRAVAEQFDQVLAVTRDVSGSSVEWLSDQQRNQVAESEAPGVLSGMLD